MIKHLVTDVDGVLNTGHFIYSAGGKQYKVFGPHDKDGIKIVYDLGLTIDFVTADASGFDITWARLVTDWGILPDCVHLVKDGTRLSWLLSKYNIAEVAYVGDGIHDAPILAVVALGIAPKGARREAIAAADFVTESVAGSGALLDACLHIRDIIHEQI